MKIALLLLLFSQSVFASTTKLEFLDSCSRKAIAASVDGVTKVGVKVEGLLPNQLIDAQVDVSPVGPREDRPRASHLKERKQIKADKFGVALFAFGTGPGRTLRIDSSARLWQANVMWQEHAGAGQGSASSRLYVMTSPRQRFYEIKTDAPIICSWRKPLELSSPYYFNHQAYDLQVTQTLPATLMQSDRGVDIGTAPSFDPSAGPLFPSSISGGWAFAGFRSLLTTTDFTASISKYLPTGQGGYFVRNVSYTRLPAREYRLKPNGSCSQWVSEREGVVDVPRVNYDFASVPADIATDSSKTLAALEAATPPLEPCTTAEGGAGDPSMMIEADREGAPVYFRAAAVK